MEPVIELIDDGEEAGFSEVIEIEEEQELMLGEAPVSDNGIQQLVNENVQIVAEVIDPVKMERRKKRRRLKQLLSPLVTPSFMAIISDNPHEYLPKRIRIDVNEYMGLKKKKETLQQATTSQTSASRPKRYSASRQQQHLPVVVSVQDEGYYEGVVPVALPDDEVYLNELHLMIRHQLEIFSATDVDVKTTSACRRTPTVRGKVGIRCIHCSRALAKLPIGQQIWPQGSVSYPLNIEGIYSCCTQKPSLHFEACPHMPQDIKGQLHRLSYDAQGNSIRRQNLSTATNKKSTLSAVHCYLVAAKRIGLVNVQGGIRFGRDLSLDPLSVESVRSQVVKTKASKHNNFAPSLVSSTTSVDTPRIAADEESERVLASAIAEKDTDTIIGKSDDSKLVTDFIFLCVRQMALCHATPADFETRGKKTALMRLGFAGFCCRHCSSGIVNWGGMDYSCRSFTSSADNLSSAISNSFFVHLQKCHQVPIELRKAMAAYKRLHSRQIARLPHGSQRRLFHAVWVRLRAADISEEQMQERIKNAPPAPAPPVPPPNILPVAAATDTTTPPDSVLSTSKPMATPDKVSSLKHLDEFKGCYPPCDDPETAELLRTAEANTDYEANDNIFLPHERPLITDYVFFMMRNMRVAIPNEADFSRGRRTTVLNTKLAGFCCQYCNGKDSTISATGRTFPSQPDNMASSLNTSLYHHFLRCYYVPDNIKRAVANLKKLHSAQCANLRFGSQRRFFNMVFARLRQVEIPHFDDSVPSTHATAAVKVEPETQETKLSDCDFLRISSDMIECSHCRLVPLSLRAPNAVLLSSPSCKLRPDLLEKHKAACARTSLYLGGAADMLAKILETNRGVSYDALEQESFRAVVSELVGSKLVSAFCDQILGLVKRKRNDVEPNSVETNDAVPWTDFSWQRNIDFDRVASLFRTWADTIEGLDSALAENKPFLSFFQVISPSFIVPSPGSKKEADAAPRVSDNVTDAPSTMTSKTTEAPPGSPLETIMEAPSVTTNEIAREEVPTTSSGPSVRESATDTPLMTTSETSKGPPQLEAITEAHSIAGNKLAISEETLTS